MYKRPKLIFCYRDKDEEIFVDEKNGQIIDLAHQVQQHFFKNLLSPLQSQLKDSSKAWAIYDLYFQRVSLPYSVLHSILINHENCLKIRGENLSRNLQNLIFSWGQSRKIQVSFVGRKIIFENFFLFFLNIFLIFYSLASFFYLWIFVRKDSPVFIWTGEYISEDSFDSRLGNFYQHLLVSKKKYVECVRHNGASPKLIFKNILKRKRPVIYYNSLENLCIWFETLFPPKKLAPLPNYSEKDNFLIFCSYQFIPTIKGITKCINIWNKIFVSLHANSFVVWFFSSRTAGLIWGANKAGVKTIGFMHGLSPRKYMGHEYLNEYQGKPFGIDVFGVWGKYWLDEFQNHSKLYDIDNIKLSGPLRPANNKNYEFPHSDKLKVLFVSEQSLPAHESLPYLKELLDQNFIEVTLKIRSPIDLHYEELKIIAPEIIAKLKIDHGPSLQVIANHHLVVGSHSTVVLESVLLNRAFVFYQTHKWGDIFNFSQNHYGLTLFAHDQRELVKILEKINLDYPKKELFEDMQNKYFGKGDGSLWIYQQCLDKKTKNNSLIRN